MSADARFEDTHDRLYDFMTEVLVECPRCAACARSLPSEPAERPWFATRRLTCVACGFVKDWESGSVAAVALCDPHFRLPLWLQAPCAGNTLWAYNRDHLELIASFVGAKLRETSRRPGTGWSNRSLVNRLPKWIQAAGNRDAVLRAIEKLETRLAATEPDR